MRNRLERSRGDVPNYHERQAAHLRALAESTTTISVKMAVEKG